MSQSRPDSAYDSDADDISYKSSSSASSSSSVSFDSSSESSSSPSSFHDGSKSDGQVVSSSPCFSSHLLSPPPLVSNRIDTPLQQQEQLLQQHHQQIQQLLQQQQYAASASASFQSPSMNFRPRSRSTSSFSSPLVSHNHTRQQDVANISPLASTVGIESTPTAVTRSSSSRRNSIASLVEPNENMATTFQDHVGDYYPETRPLSRPRSNTRRNSTSTPTSIRNATPVLGPVNRSTLAASEAHDSNHRHGSQSRNRRVNVNVNVNSNSSTTSPRLVGLGANLAVGTVLPSASTSGGVRGSSSLSVLRERTSRRMLDVDPSHYPSKSCKQGPGHRKVRRWNNDLFIGIAKDISCSHARNPQKGARIANIYAEAEMDKARYTMPHVPRHQWTVFRALMEGGGSPPPPPASVDGDAAGFMQDQDDENDLEMGRKALQEKRRFLSDPGHVARVRERFLEGEVSTMDNDSDGRKEARLEIHKQHVFQNGHAMIHYNVNKRLLNIVTRTCRMPGFSRNVVDAFESVLVENMSVDNMPNKHGVKTSRSSQQQQDCNQVWDQVLVQKPFVTTRKKIVLEQDIDTTNNDKSTVMVRMIFSEDGSKAAFHRLLLHAVCQFHGLEVSTSVTSKGHKMLTVTGVCKRHDLRFLDFVPFEDGNDNHAGGGVSGGRHIPNQATQSIEKHPSSHESRLVTGMSTLQVQ